VTKPNHRIITIHFQTIILQQRYCPSAENCTTTWRSWTDDNQQEMLEILKERFPHSRIMSISDTTADAVSCLACEVRGYAEADVLIGLHGAGLTNTMFMHPGTILFEITGQFDGRMLPHCGYHGPMANVFGVHHYIYYYDWRGEQPLDFGDAMTQLGRFYGQLHETSKT
jgi:hypothetical protein